MEDCRERENLMQRRLGTWAIAKPPPLICARSKQDEGERDKTEMRWAWLSDVVSEQQCCKYEVESRPLRISFGGEAATQAMSGVRV